MENTLENKKKFFAQYWGQEILREDYCDFTFKVGSLEFSDNKIEISSLYLKSLSSITNEDALQLGRLLNNYISSDYKDDLKYCKEIINRFNNNGFKSSGVEVIDYLKAKGYALPYMGLSVEKQTEYGWIKLI